jgi:hypothetical protein
VPCTLNLPQVFDRAHTAQRPSAAVGRDPATIERSVQLIADPADLGAARDTLRGFIAAGATHLILNLRAPYPEGIVHRLADEVAEPLRAAYAAAG